MALRTLSALLALSILPAAASGATPAETCPSPAQALVLRAADPGAQAARDAAGEARRALEAGELETLGARLAHARSAADAVADAAMRAQLLIHVGRTSARLADAGPADGAAHAREAAAAFSAAADAAAGVDGRLRAYATGYLAELYERAGRHEEAHALTLRAIFAAQTAEAYDALYRFQWQRARLERAAGREGEALAAYRQAVRALAEVRADTAFESKGSEAEFRNEVAPVYTQFVDLLLQQADAKPAEADRQPLLLEARGALEDLKAAELRDYFRDSCLEAQRTTTPELVAGAVVIYPIVLPDRVEIIVSRGESTRSYRAPVSGEKLTAEVRELRRLLEKRVTRQFLRPARNVYDWLIRPIAPSLVGDVDALVFVPDGALRTIPFAALYDGEKREYLIEQHPVAITPGLTLTDPRPLPRRPRLLAAGISESVQGFPALDNVPRELAAVQETFPSRELVDEEFRVASLESEVQGRAFGIVHIASHGEFSADASESFLLAWDGKVSMDHLADLVGTTRFRTEQPLELLVLSACQTATGDERAALGLAGVAVRAGARSALATLWSVNDQASTDLITAFYAGLGRPDTSRARALQAAQLSLLQQHHYRHPAYWSPFLLINSWL